MASLPDSLRRRLENTVVKARDEAENGAGAALQRLAVGLAEPPDMMPEETELRTKLRAHARQLGDPRKASGEQEIERLVSECAYEHWHRMLFARFLAENQLLIHSDHDVPVTLAECEELAAEAGVEDGWTLAARFAARMLPAIFRPDDPVLSVRLAPEHLQPLEKLLADLPVEVFTANDGLGWVYQFWQSKRKKAVNKSGVKIGADEIPVVTQLFTEPYMVQFLLHNTLGAWWAGKVLARQPELAVAATGEEELRAACTLPGYAWSYLRFIRLEEGDMWRPAAGSFDGWPERAAEITVLDPCCGSGHFLVEAFRLLVSLRKAEEDLSAREACAAVLRDNLFGLEIDERCTQIAAFNLALAAWTYPEGGGYRPLPELQIACSGLSVGAKEEEWLNLAGKDDHLRQGMRRLYHLFKDAPTLGSLIDPRGEFEPDPLQRSFLDTDFQELQPILARALESEPDKRDAQVTEVGIAAQGLAKAASLLARSYTLVTTNVPYLGGHKQSDPLQSYIVKVYGYGKSDLATAFVLRALDLCSKAGSAGLVTSQHWLSLATYTDLRESLLIRRTWNMVARLGTGAFTTIGGRVVNVAIIMLSAIKPSDEDTLSGVDATLAKRPREKAALLRGDKPASIATVPQLTQTRNPGARISVSTCADTPTLKDFCEVYEGTGRGDTERFDRFFWEMPVIDEEIWAKLLNSPNETAPFRGREIVFRWEQGHGELSRTSSVRIRGVSAWSRRAVFISRTSETKATLSLGEIHAQNGVAVVPAREDDLLALWAYCSSKEYRDAVRKISSKIIAPSSALWAVPFNLEQWQKVAGEKYPDGLPEPESDDPTQWLFHGRPEASTAPLQVAIARLLGYRWPAELDETMRLSSRAKKLIQRCAQLQDLADADGIVCIPPVRGEQPAAERLQRLLAQAFGAAWTPAALPALLDRAESSGKTLDDWLRGGFFEQHCQLFHQWPFIWHIWDGRKRDGFAALVNYHKLDRKLLERLTYTVLGDWITHQRQGAKTGELGAEDRLAAAEALQRKLALILEGEPPYDIFVRWKPLNAQTTGWNPDLNDGVRMNIRPFVEAGVLRKNPRIKWNKDGGGEPQSLRSREQFPWFWRDGEFRGERVNDIHLTNAQRRAAQAAKGR
jgi:hypothetical protein